MKPMLACTVQVADVRYPVLASAKLDGVRGVVIDGRLRSRSLKPIPNRHVTAKFSRPEFDGLDGELILGSPTAPDVFRQTSSACSREDGEPTVRFYVFDRYTAAGTFDERAASLNKFASTGGPLGSIVVLPQMLVTNEVELLAFEERVLGLGFEGLILRDPSGAYKFGRSTKNERGMMKLKRFMDSEAEVLEVIEEQANTNAATVSELGGTARSSHKAGMVPKGRAGALRVRDVTTNVVFQIGTGFNDDDKEYLWRHRAAVVGKLVKYKSFLIGVKDAPRFPVYLGGRETWDLS